MPMKNPVHPGRIVRRNCLEPLGLSVTAGARILGVSRQALNNIVNGKSGISPEMAIRLTKAFGSTAETWLRQWREHRVLVRWFNYPETRDYVRITIGTDAEIDALLAAARKILAG